MPAPDRDPAFERRLDELRREAQTSGSVNGRGVDIAGSPLPIARVKAGPKNVNGQHIREQAQVTQSGSGKPGYFGMPVLKEPVWTWEISIYFFVGGLTGMAAAVARGRDFFPASRRWPAPPCGSPSFGGVVSPVLLIMDLGRPLMFFNMLRGVQAAESPMSMGVYILTPYGMASIPGALAVETGVARHLLAAEAF